MLGKWWIGHPGGKIHRRTRIMMSIFRFQSSAARIRDRSGPKMQTAPRVISSCVDNVELEVEEEEGNMWSGGN